MSARSALQIRYHFEPVRDDQRSPLAEIARNISNISETAPWLLPELRVGSASIAARGVLSLPEYESPARVRLRAIEIAGESIIENEHDAIGQIRRTNYPDGTTVCYSWDTHSRMTEAQLPNSEKIVWSYDSNDKLVSITYPGSNIFRIEYNNEGQIKRQYYPDGWGIAFDYDASRRLFSANSRSGATTIRRTDVGELHSVEFTSNGRVHGIEFTQDGLSLSFVPASSGGGVGTVASPLGLWRFDGDGAARDMLLSDGERFYAVPSKRANQSIFWSSSGQSSFEYSSLNQLRACLFHDGTRLVFHGSGDPTKVYAVTAQSVSLYEYGSDRRLLHIRNSDGSYARFSYRRNGTLRRIETASGAIETRFEENGRLQQIVLPTGATANIAYTSGGIPSHMAVRRVRGDGYGAAMVAARTFWQLSALASTLRLYDVVVAT